MDKIQQKQYWIDKEEQEAQWLRLAENQRRHKLFLEALLLQAARGTEARYTEPPRKWRRERYHWRH